MSLGRACLTSLALGLATPALAAVTPYSDYSDFASLNTIGATGIGLVTSTEFSVNATSGTSNGEEGIGSSPSGSPLEFTGFSAFEVGMTFGNDQITGNDPANIATFDVILEAFAGTTSLGSVTVTANGNDVADQFIGFGTMTAFDKVVLDYGPGSVGTARFITEARFGLDEPAPIPLPAALPLLLLGLGGLGLARARKAV